MDPALYIGRSVGQTQEFVNGEIKPLLEANKDVIGMKAEINV